jgi:hypothetical protein
MKFQTLSVYKLKNISIIFFLKIFLNLFKKSIVKIVKMTIVKGSPSYEWYSPKPNLLCVTFITPVALLYRCVRFPSDRELPVCCG